MKNRTKIVATIGPASVSQKKLIEMMKKGMNVCRLNFSHGDYVWHKKAFKNIRAAEKKAKIKVAIIADIQGPRIRVATKKGVMIKRGEKVFLTDESSPVSARIKKTIRLDWKDFYQLVRKGEKVFIEDGLIQLEVVKKDDFGCFARVLVGGTVKNHKGVNIPAISSHMGFLTDKDLDDLKFILTQDVDYIAASFVSCKKDLLNLRTLVEYFAELNNKEAKEKIKFPAIISKVERRSAMKNIKDVVKFSDGIMVARGDLAIEMAQEKVAILQKEIINFCIKGKKPVIVATQMMASMIEKARPTRAEISDVTNAVIDNADAVMLSNESAVGKYPVEVIETMSEIVKQAEKSPYNDKKLKKNSKFARLVFQRKSGSKVITAENIEELQALSSLRQESVRLKLSKKDKENERRAVLIWGAEV